MISNVIVHCGMGNTGGTIVREILDKGLASKVAWIDTGAHLPIKHARALKAKGPAIGQVRNPFDWYIATWQTELQYHHWRGGFRDWFYNRWSIPYQALVPERIKGVCMWDWFLYFSEVEKGKGPAYDYVLQFERLERDLIMCLEDIGIVPKMLSVEWVRKQFPIASMLTVRRPWIEGIEQWMRDELYTKGMMEQVFKQDAPIFERFGYTFEEKYYYVASPFAPSREAGWSCHDLDVRVGNWEQEQRLSASWVEWGSERSGPFARPSQTTSTLSTNENIQGLL